MAGEKDVSFEHRIGAVARKDLDDVKRAVENVLREVDHAIASGAEKVDVVIVGHVHHGPAADKPQQEPTTATDATVAPETPKE